MKVVFHDAFVEIESATVYTQLVFWYLDYVIEGR